MIQNLAFCSVRDKEVAWYVPGAFFAFNYWMPTGFDSQIEAAKYDQACEWRRNELTVRIIYHRSDIATVICKLRKSRMNVQFADCKRLRV